MTPTLPPSTLSEGQRLPAEIFENAPPPPAPAPAPPAQPDTAGAGSGDDTGTVPDIETDLGALPPAVVEEPSPSSDMLTGLGDILLAANKDIALILLAAGCFFFGVILSVLTPGREEGHGRATAVAAPMTFLLTAPLWFPLLAGGLVKTSIAPIDSILAYAIDGSIRGQMFAFGIVMVIGYHAAAVFRLIDKVFKGLLSFIASKAPKVPPPAADGG